MCCGMKNSLCLTLLLCLTACVQVKNWGCYGQSFFQDTRLLGNWITETDKPERQLFKVWPYQTGYIVASGASKLKQVAEHKHELFWTIKIEGLDFMTIGGLLHRYEFVDDQLRVLELDTEGRSEQIRTTLAASDNFHLDEVKFERAQLTYKVLNIERLDAASAAMLVKLASKPELWKQKLSARRSIK